jgi:hypothetical protein
MQPPPPPPSTSRAAPTLSLLSAILIGIIFAESAFASDLHWDHPHYHQNPISLLSTCTPSSTLSWSRAAASSPSLIVRISSICLWLCDSSVSASPIHPHGVHLTLTASVALSPSQLRPPHPTGYSTDWEHGSENSLVVTADASPSPSVPHAPIACSSLSPPVTFILTFPSQFPALFSNVTSDPPPSVISLCLTGRSLSPPHLLVYLPPCLSTTLPPPPTTDPPSPPPLLPALLICTPQPSYACNHHVTHIVSQGSAAQAASRDTRHGDADANPSRGQDTAPHFERRSQFEIAFQVGRGTFTGCSRLLLLPPSPAAGSTSSPMFASSEFQLPTAENQFPFRLSLNVSLLLHAPMFQVDGMLQCRSIDTSHTASPVPSSPLLPPLPLPLS